MKKLALLCLTMTFLTLSAPAADWPQWQGPTHDNISTEKGLLAAIPAGGPKLVWQFTDCGHGFGSPSIVGEKLFIAGTEGKNEVLFCLNSQTGKPVWAKPAVLGPFKKLDHGDGPRASPSVDGDRVYILDSAGTLLCADTATGKEVWKKSLVSDLGGSVPRWGYSESPLVDGDLVLCTPGGGKGTVAALNKKSGEVVWRSKDITDGAAYSSIVPIEFGGIRQYVQATGSSVFGVEAKTGKVLWKQVGRDKVAVNPIATIPTPLYHDGYVYQTSSYGAGCCLIKLEKSGDGVTSSVVYLNKVMENHHGGVVLLDGHIYGARGNANKKLDGNLVCQDMLTGKEIWTDKKIPEMPSLTVADGKLFLYGQDTGTLIMTEVSAKVKGVKELGRFTIPAESKLPRGGGKIWAHPVVANGKLYLRDLDLLFCFDLSAK